MKVDGRERVRPDDGIDIVPLGITCMLLLM